jgi:hypothetical protein
MAFEKTNVKMITKTSSIINNLISFSRDTLKQNKGLEMLPHEKADLRKEFNENKDHIVAAMNIMMFLERQGILKILSDGKRFDWNEMIIASMIKNEVPSNYSVISRRQHLAGKLLNKHKEAGYLALPVSERTGSIANNEKDEVYLLKHFAERYSSVHYLI